MGELLALIRQAIRSLGKEVRGWFSESSIGGPAGAKGGIFYFIQDTIDEVSALFGGIFFREVDSFVDGNDGRNIEAVLDFINGQPENGSVDGGHAVQGPVFRVFGDFEVGGIGVFEGATNEGFGEGANGEVFGCERG